MAAAQETAEAAWNRGDHEAAARLYALRLQDDSTDTRALHRLGLIHAWSERFEEALPLLNRLVRLEPDNLDAGIDRARVLAWARRYNQSIAALDAILERHPGYLPALRARAEFGAWSGEFEEAAAAYEQLTAVAPGDRDVIRDQARVLSWGRRFTRAIAIYDSLVASDPDDLDARLGLARILAWDGQYDSASVVYESVTAAAPDNVEAQRGQARVATWAGDLRRGEARWRAVLEHHPDDVESLVGFGQNLRWQGRSWLALTTLERALTIDPGNADVVSQLRWARIAIRPRVSATFVYEHDSDGNRIFSTLLRTAWRPHPRIELGWEGYRRSAGVQDPTPPTRQSLGTTFSLLSQFDPGWSLSGGLGISTSDASGAPAIGNVQARITSPSRDRVQWYIGVSRAAFDYTATLIANNVHATQWTAGGRFRVRTGTQVTASLDAGAFSGFESNRRLGGRAALTQAIGREWSVGPQVYLFGFAKDLNEGYFDPDFYGVVEAAGRWTRAGTRWSATVEAAPGVQQVRSTGDPAATVRASARIVYTAGPGRDAALSGVYSSTGINSLSTTNAEYRYRAVTLSVTWSF